MVKRSEMRTTSQVRAAALRDPKVAAQAARAEFAHQVALAVVTYRSSRGLTQTALAQILGIPQSTVARLEAGTHEPSNTTLERLARELGMEFHLAITEASPVLTLVRVITPKSPRITTVKKKSAPRSKRAS